MGNGKERMENRIDGMPIVAQSAQPVRAKVLASTTTKKLGDFWPSSSDPPIHGNVERVGDYLDFILGRSAANSFTPDLGSPRAKDSGPRPDGYFSPHGARAQRLQAEEEKKKGAKKFPCSHGNSVHLESSARSPARHPVSGKIVVRKKKGDVLGFIGSSRGLPKRKIDVTKQRQSLESEWEPSTIAPSQIFNDIQFRRRLETCAEASVKRRSVRNKEVIVTSGCSNSPSSSSEDNFVEHGSLQGADGPQNNDLVKVGSNRSGILDMSPSFTVRNPKMTAPPLFVPDLIWKSTSAKCNKRLVSLSGTCGEKSPEFHREKKVLNIEMSPSFKVVHPRRVNITKRKKLFSRDVSPSFVVQMPQKAISLDNQNKMLSREMSPEFKVQMPPGVGLVASPTQSVEEDNIHDPGDSIYKIDLQPADVLPSPPPKETFLGQKRKKRSLGKTPKRAPKGQKDAMFVEEKLKGDCILEDSKKHCCPKCCVGFLGWKNIRDIRTQYFLLSPRSRTHSIQWGIQRSDCGKRLRTMVLPGGQQICRTAFKIILCIGNCRLNRLLKREARSNDRPTKVTSPQGLLLREWMDAYFMANCERQPDAQIYHLPSNYTKGEVYDYYKTTIGLTDPFSLMALSSFNRIWRDHFAAVKIPKNSRFSICETCESLKAARDLAKTPAEKDENVRCLKLHREQQSAERQKLAKHRKKCYQSNQKYLGIVVDGMDQKKTAVPHFAIKNKKVENVTLAGVHLVGALIFNETLSSRVFLTYGNLRADSNLTVTIINKILLSFQGNLPECLYLQLDNTTRENKNGILFAYLSMLIELRVFKKIKLGFLPVGHTHDQIDQMFSRFSTSLNRLQAFTLPELEVVIQESYKPKPKIELLKETWDFKSMLEGFPKPVCKLTDMTFNQQFRFKILEDDSHGRVWSKQFSTDKHWLPKEGLRHVVGHFRYLPIGSSEQVPLKSYAELKKSDQGNRKVSPILAFEDIKKQITQSCFPFFNDEQKRWWDEWFSDQAEIAFRIAGKHLRPLDNEWVWPQSQREEEDSMQVDDTPQHIVVSEEEVRSKVFGPRRPMYAGSRQARPGTKTHDRHHRLGDIDEIEVGSFVAVLSPDNSNPFWICEVLAVKSRVGNKEPKDIQIQWYKSTAGEGVDPFESVFHKELVKKKCKGKKGVERLNIVDIDIQSVTVLAFNFVLTNTYQLRKATVATIREQLFLHAQDEAQPSPSMSGADTENNEDNLDNDDAFDVSTSDSEYRG